MLFHCFMNWTAGSNAGTDSLNGEWCESSRATMRMMMMVMMYHNPIYVYFKILSKLLTLRWNVHGMSSCKGKQTISKSVSKESGMHHLNRSHESIDNGWFIVFSGMLRLDQLYIFSLFSLVAFLIDTWYLLPHQQWCKRKKLSLCCSWH